ncbi:MAG: hypothetical protein KME25_29940 [Symplocastrum torsivum CPER-KK1]|jgi:hypothetical protein|uniref:Uncharacterized protein n=1 Tax=Symplocastrum torsivum CPER-KK1 TaxID=450513 RepID=A0A951PTU7_9CYAN|nr:hypothetical protein [Symplocastrum torsivum CPER-KK1]
MESSEKVAQIPEILEVEHQFYFTVAQVTQFLSASANDCSGNPGNFEQ